jgi:ParB/RepB/Spo0J family partition protein
VTAAQLELTEPTIKKIGKKWAVICPACGEVGKNTTEAYAKEAAGAHVTDAHPDWTIQTIDRPAPVLELRDLPVAQLAPSPHNPRGGDLGDIDGLAASIASVGVIEPLIVEPDPTTDGWTLVAGERRWTAAKQAGLDTVPCVVRPAVDDDHRLELMLIENLQREGVNPMGEARAFRTLEQLGLSQRTIAARVGCSQSHISKRLALLDLPAAVQKRVGERPDAGGITVAAALELTKLKDNPKAITEITKAKKLESDDIARRVQQAEREAAEKAKVEEFRAAAKANGWTVVKYDGYSLPKSVKPFSTSQWDNDLKLDPKKHETEPCHGLVVADYHGRPSGRPVCTDPKRHGPKGDSALKLPVEKKRQLSDHEIKEREQQRARAAAATRRTEALRQALAPAKKGSVKIDPVRDTIFRTVIRQLSSDERRVCCEILGLGRPDYYAAEMWAAADADLGRVAAAAALAVGELRARAPYAGWEAAEIQDLYAYLQTADYELDEFETERLGKAAEQTDEALRTRLMAMVEAVAAGDDRDRWLAVARRVDVGLISDFFGDGDDDTPVDQIDDDTIAAQAFAEFFADELADPDADDLEEAAS